MKELEKVRARVIEAVPGLRCEEALTFKKLGKWFYAYDDIQGRNQHSGAFATKQAALGHAYGYGFYKTRAIRLADVLVAVAHSVAAPNEATAFQMGERVKEYDQKLWSVVSRWEWRNDSLDGQTPETISFLYKVLGCV